MDKWTTLEPVKLHGSPSSSTARLTHVSTKSLGGAAQAHQNRAQFIGKLPSELHLLILHFLAIPDIPSYARVNRPLSRLAGDERVWERRWNVLIGIDSVDGVREKDVQKRRLKAEEKIDRLLDELQKRKDTRGVTQRANGASHAHIKTSTGSVDLSSLAAVNPNHRMSLHTQPAIIPVVQVEDDEFGDFATADLAADEFDDFVGATPTAKHHSFPVIAPQPSLFTTPSAVPSLSGRTSPSLVSASKSRTHFIRAFSLLQPLLIHIHPSTAPHTLLSLLLPTPPPPPQAVPGVQRIMEPTLQTQAQILSLLTRFLSSSFQPSRDWVNRSHALRSAVDRFEAGVLKLFEDADGKSDERGMREAAWASWEVFTAWGTPKRKPADRSIGGLLFGGVGRFSRLKGAQVEKEWELGKVWVERKEIFYEQGKWNPLANFVSNYTLSFNPMDSFLSHVIGVLTSAANTSKAVFPVSSNVLTQFAERVGNDIVAEYVNTLVNRARDADAEKTNSQGREGKSQPNTLNSDGWETGMGAEQGEELYLQAMAASFVMCWKIVDTLSDVGGEMLLRGDVEGILFNMFDPHMDEYLDEEVEAVKRSFESICRDWEQKNQSDAIAQNLSPTRTRFLTSQNPQQVKRNVVAGFTNVLMMPVTIIPRAVGAVGTLAVGAATTTGKLALGAATTTGSLAVGAAKSGIAGISMLNPAKWGATSENTERLEGYITPLAEEDGDGDGSYLTVNQQTSSWIEEQDQMDGWGSGGKRQSFAITPTTAKISPFIKSPNRVSLSTTPSFGASTPTAVDTEASSIDERKNEESLPTLDHFLSLDVALQLIHAARDSMKRLESFFPPSPPTTSHKTSTDKPRSGPWSISGFPGPAGRKLRETLEEIFILLLIALRERHLEPGLEKAIERMRQYKPVNHDPGTTSAVAPLLGFFELVHVGDTIGSMIQVYFDREMTPYIDVNDFLSGVMREKKKFENSLDEEVAKGLNAGTEVLMTQVEHVLWTRTVGREYCPPEGTVMDELGPTQGCKDVIECLEIHCRVVRGSTNREVLEVFYAEVGMRLHALIQKHLKRQIISLEGGIQVIADLNAYYNFMATLKVPHLLQEFASLKMLGHVYVVADAKDLATIVRDVTRYGGAFRPEDVYEFVQRRSDWKKIEKEVDRTMYNLSFKEDCVIC